MVRSSSKDGAADATATPGLDGPGVTELAPTGGSVLYYRVER